MNTDTELLNQTVATLVSIEITARRQNPAVDSDSERLQVIGDLAQSLLRQIRAEFEARAGAAIHASEADGGEGTHFAK